MESAEEYKKVNLTKHVLAKETRGGIQTIWKAPLEGTYKVNLDTAVDKVHGRMRIKILVRDHEGHVNAAKSMTRMGNIEPNTADTLAVSYATLSCKEIGLQNIILER